MSSAGSRSPPWASFTITGAVRLWQLVTLAAVYGAGEALFGPANTAIVPELVPRQMLMQANSLSQFVRPFAATLLGPLVLGAVVILLAVVSIPGARTPERDGSLASSLAGPTSDPG